MATQEKYPTEGISHVTSPSSSVIQKGNSLGTEWQTPVISEPFRSRFSRCSSVADSGDTAIGTSCSDIAEDFCSSSGSPSFQPIKSHVTIPTAHVMPSTLGTSPAKPNSTPVGPSSSKLPLSGLAESVGMTRNGDLGAMKRSPGLSRDLMYLSGPTGENGIEQSWFPAVGHERQEDVRKFDIPSMESTLNQSAMMETLYSDPHHRVHFHNPRTNASKELYKVLPEAKKAPGSGAVFERNGPHPNSSGVLPLGLQPAPGLSKTLPSQVWQPSPDTWHPREQSCELSTCRQQLELIRLQMEQMQLQNGAICHHPAAFAPSLPILEPAQWISILNSNEHLLKEKELLIDKQRKHISQLEQKVRESELQVRSALLGRPAPFGDVCLLRLQELQRENTFLRAQFAQKTEALSKDKIELEKKLSASEVEVQLIRESLKVALQKHSEEVKKQEERVKGRDKHINNLKKKCQKESEQNREKQQRIETLERYLADLPTLEDHQKQSQQLKDCELKSTELQEKVTELESLLEETQAICREKEIQLESLRQREAEFSSTRHSPLSFSLQDKQSVEQTSGEGPEVEIESWQKQCDSLQKIVEKQQQNMDQLRLQVQNLEQEVAQEEGTSQALREEAQRRDAALQQLHTAVKELSVQNQDLIEKNLTLQEHLRQAQPGSPPSPDMAQLALELHQELASCLQDLQAVCSIVTQRAQGHDPNLSLLLGIHSTQHPETQLDLQKPDVIKKKLEEVQQLHRDIEDLRTTMSDRYAQDMGENCVTQ
nr:centrosomal protein of 85 kDa isoform X3 [Aotus nancymaae]XP_012295441.1 centrosomal protein of 85 kDa isoform X3 [Aotus nancymaae]XP_012295442.1 centrosomal protein of 85 kDa isoform X3 [Aotus nancymaae]XP_012295443.1 centrosomal protein of 85 kDa isoform X3 [Aotus nancymaae]XP_012295444.1 centrosomal protein of 85 kDa isoform X3 [Aotus nancymaae]